MSLDSSSRVGRTAVQVGLPACLVTIGTWGARLAGIDLDPGPGQDMPPEVVGAFIGVLTVLGAVLMNRKPKTVAPIEATPRMAEGRFAGSGPSLGGGGAGGATMGQGGGGGA